MGEFWLVEACNLISEVKMAPFPQAQHPRYLLPQSLLQFLTTIL